MATINIIFVAPRREVGLSFGIKTTSPQLAVRDEHKESKRSKNKEGPILGFSKADKVETY